MVWGAISYKGTIDLVVIEWNMDSGYNVYVLQLFSRSQADAIFGENWIFQHDNAVVHTSDVTKMFTEANDIEVLDWPAKLPDLNVIYNV